MGRCGFLLPHTQVNGQARLKSSQVTLFVWEPLACYANAHTTQCTHREGPVQQRPSAGTVYTPRIRDTSRPHTVHCAARVHRSAREARRAQVNPLAQIRRANLSAISRFSAIDLTTPKSAGQRDP